MIAEAPNTKIAKTCACGQPLQPFSRFCEEHALAAWMEHEAANQSVWTDTCAAPVATAPEGCTIRVPWANAHCAQHTAAFYRLLDEPTSIESPEPRKGNTDGANEPDPAFRAQRDEAMRYIAEYTGTWGFILDLRADRKWGTKWFRLSRRQVEVILASKARDAERAANRDPRQDAVMMAVADNVDLLKKAPAFVISILGQHNTGRALSEKQVAAVERWTAEQATKAAEAPKTETLIDRAKAAKRAGKRDGFYMVDGEVYKVQLNLRETGVYAKHLVVENDEARWEYAPGALRLLNDDNRMTAEQAAEFGHLYGFCAVCGRRLTDESSIARGIGPVCSEKLAF